MVLILPVVINLLSTTIIRMVLILTIVIIILLTMALKMNQQIKIILRTMKVASIGCVLMYLMQGKNCVTAWTNQNTIIVLSIFPLMV